MKYRREFISYSSFGVAAADIAAVIALLTVEKIDQSQYLSTLFFAAAIPLLVYAGVRFRPDEAARTIVNHEEFVTVLIAIGGVIASLAGCFYVFKHFGNDPANLFMSVTLGVLGVGYYFLYRSSK